MKYTFKDLREVMNEDNSMDFLLMRLWRDRSWLEDKQEKDIKDKMFLVGRKLTHIIDELEKEHKQLNDQLHSLQWKIRELYSQVNKK